MYGQLARYIKESLSPYDDSHADLVARLEELERRLRNMNIAGVVHAIHGSGKLIQVSYGERKTGWIHWFASAAGEISDYRCPSVGEQCLLLNYGGGEDSGQVWALCGVPSDAFPLPGGGDPSKRIVTYSSGITETYDSEGTLTVKAATKVITDTPELHGTGEVSDQKRTMKADRAIFDGHHHLAKGATSLTDVPDNKQG